VEPGRQNVVATRLGPEQNGWSFALYRLAAASALAPMLLDEVEGNRSEQR